MIKGIDKGTLLASVCVAASLMFGVLSSVWLSILDAVAGRTVYSLAACVVMVVAGLGVGFLTAGWPCRKVRDPVVLLRVLLLLLGCWLVFQLVVAPGMITGWLRILNDLSRSVSQYVLTLAKTAVFLALVPSVLAGAAVRVSLVACVPPSLLRQGQAITLVVLLGVLPASAGWGLAAGAFVPFAGVESVMRLAALWFGALASLSYMRSVLSAFPFLGVIVALVVLNPRGQASVLTDAVFSRLVHRDSGFARGKPVFAHRSRHHTVSVYDDSDYQFVFALDGRPMLFGNRFHTARTLTGYVPLLLRPGCKKAAVFGPEAGFYLPFFLRAGVAQVKYAGADPAVVKLALAADGYMTGEDTSAKGGVRQGATLSEKESYDLVLLASEPVWMRGVGGAYSRNLFRRCRSALSADGLVALHLDARALSPTRFAAITRLFAQEFPSVQIWCTGVYDWLLIGGKSGIQVPADAMLGLFEKVPLMRDFARAGVLSLPEVLASMLCEGKDLKPWLERTGSETAFQAAWLAPLTVFGVAEPPLTPDVLEKYRQRKTDWVLQGALDEEVYQAIRAKTRQCVEGRSSAVTALAETAKGEGDTGLAAARAASKLNPRDALLLHLSEVMELEGRRRIAIGEYKGALKCYENLLSFATGTARVHYGMGYCLRASGENENAYLHFARAVAAASELTAYRMELAQVAVTIGQYAEADRQYQEVLKREPDNPEALYRYAKALAVKERPDKDMTKALKLAERACERTGWSNNEYAFGLADMYMDAGRVMEGMGLKRCLKEGGKPGVTRGTSKAE